MVVSSSKDVTYLCPYSGPARGTLSVTNYKLYFKAAEREHYILDVPLGVVRKRINSIVHKFYFNSL